jgi:hypothetical protein
MNWIQENKMLAGILGFMGAGVLALGAWLYFCYEDYASAQSEFNTLKADITTLESAKLYPSAENVVAKTAKVKAYEEQVSKLREVLHLNQQAIKPISETDFQARLKERSNDISLRAKRSGMALPANFALGFDEYTGSLPKSPEMAAELNLHLDVMEKLVGTIVESGVKQLESIARTRLPSEKGATAPAAVPAPVKPVAKTGGKAASSAPLVAVEPVLDRYAINLDLNCDQASLQNVVNTIANPSPKTMPFFMVVRLMRIDNQKKDAPTREEVKEKIRASSVASTPATPPETPANAPAGAPVPAPQDAAAVMGDELLHVHLEVDYIRLRDEFKLTPALTGGKR